MIDEQVIATEVRKITDAQWAGHEGWPTTFMDSLLRWITVLHRSTATMIPASVSRNAAVTAATLTPPGIATVTIPLAWKNYATVLATGMTGFVATPPPLLLDLSSVTRLGLGGASAEICANELARITKLWLKTGVAVPTSSGPTIRWN